MNHNFRTATPFVRRSWRAITTGACSAATGPFDQEELCAAIVPTLDGDRLEGMVVRTAAAFASRDSDRHVGKLVRASHQVRHDGGPSPKRPPRRGRVTRRSGSRPDPGALDRTQKWGGPDLGTGTIFPSAGLTNGKNGGG